MVKAIVCHQHGGLDTLSLDDITIDPPAPGQVHIRIRAAGINFPDTLQISGTYQSKTFPPFTPGQEVAGDIIACGEGVDRFKPGDRVLATTGLGGYAEEVVAAAEWVTPKCPMAWITSLVPVFPSPTEPRISRSNTAPA